MRTVEFWWSGYSVRIVETDGFAHIQQWSPDIGWYDVRTEPVTAGLTDDDLCTACGYPDAIRDAE